MKRRGFIAGVFGSVAGFFGLSPAPAMRKVEGFPAWAIVFQPHRRHCKPAVLAIFAEQDLALEYAEKHNAEHPDLVEWQRPFCGVVPMDWHEGDGQDWLRIAWDEKP